MKFPSTLLLSFFLLSSANAETQLLIKTKQAVVGARALVGQAHWKKLVVRDADKATVLQRLRQDPRVEWVEEDRRYGVDSVERINDPYFDQQWSLIKSQVPEAWGFISVNAPGILVAVLDTGVDGTHPDLAAQIFTNTREIPNNGIDDDRNGFVDDVHGFNFEEKSGDASDDFHHGTHIAGIIAATINNNTGIAGIAPKAQILPVKWMKKGAGWGADAIEGIHYAIKMGARVINASWGGIGYSKALEEAVREAEAHGILFVASAGNHGTNNDVKARHPANLRLSNVVTVADLDSQDMLTKTSNYGKTQVELGAPGTLIMSTLIGRQYGKFSGTSMAAAHVSGVAALLLTVNSKLTGSELKKIMVETTTKVSSLKEKTISGGRINALAAAKRAAELRVRPRPFIEFELENDAMGIIRVSDTGLHPDRIEAVSAANGLSLQFIRMVKGVEVPIEGLVFKAQLLTSTGYKTYRSDERGVITDSQCAKSEFTATILLESPRYSITDGSTSYQVSLTARCNVKQKIIFEEKTTNAQPLAIWQIVTGAEKKLNKEVGLKFWSRPIKFVWPAKGDYYNWDTVNLTWGHQWDVVAHEMGHAIYDQSRMGVFGGGQHYIDRCYSEGLALSEGWASFYAAWVNIALTDPDAKFEYMVPRRAPVRFENIPEDVCGKSTNEWRVTGFLWDLIDQHQDEPMNQTFARFWVDAAGLRASSVKSMKENLAKKGWNAQQLDQIWKLNFPAE